MLSGLALNAASTWTLSGCQVAPTLSTPLTHPPISQPRAVSVEGVDYPQLNALKPTSPTSWSSTYSHAYATAWSNKFGFKQSVKFKANLFKSPCSTPVLLLSLLSPGSRPVSAGSLCCKLVLALPDFKPTQASKQASAQAGCQRDCEEPGQGKLALEGIGPILTSCDRAPSHCAELWGLNTQQNSGGPRCHLKKPLGCVAFVWGGGLMGALRGCGMQLSPPCTTPSVQLCFVLLCVYRSYELTRTSTTTDTTTTTSTQTGEAPAT